MVDIYHYMGLIFVDLRTHAHCVLYNQAYFAGLIFMVRQLSVKTAKIGPLKNFPLYGSLVHVCSNDMGKSLILGKPELN